MFARHVVELKDRQGSVCRNCEDEGHSFATYFSLKVFKFSANAVAKGSIIESESFFPIRGIDNIGNRIKTPQILAFRDNVQKRPFILVGGSGAIGQTIEANSTNHEEKGITFSDFYVYNKDTIDRNDFKSQQKFDSLTTAIVNQCRQK